MLNQRNMSIRNVSEFIHVAKSSRLQEFGQFGYLSRSWVKFLILSESTSQKNMLSNYESYICCMSENMAKVKVSVIQTFVHTDKRSVSLVFISHKIATKKEHTILGL